MVRGQEGADAKENSQRILILVCLCHFGRLRPFRSGSECASDRDSIQHLCNANGPSSYRHVNTNKDAYCHINTDNDAYIQANVHT